MKRKSKRLYLHKAGMIIAAIPFWLEKLSVKAAAYDFLNDAGNDKLKKAVDAVKKEGAGYIVFWQTIGIVSVLCAILACGMAFAVKRNANMRAETKERLFYVCIAGLGVFSIATVVSVLQYLGMNI